MNNPKQGFFSILKMTSCVLIPGILIILFFCYTLKISAQPENNFSELPGKAPNSNPQASENFSEEDDFEADFEEEFKTENEKVFDPLSGYNRFTTRFNDIFFVNVLDPVAKGYHNVVIEEIRIGTYRFFKNLFFPVRFVNNALQIKFNNAGEETLRFAINSTAGILGIWDPAYNRFGFQPHDEDFGQTLGYYGVGGGFHIVLPFLGPSNLRDTLSLLPDYYLEPVGQFKPMGQLHNNFEEIAVESFILVNETSFNIGEYESLKKDAVDLYPFLRDIYEQNREKQIKE